MIVLLLRVLHKLVSKSVYRILRELKFSLLKKSLFFSELSNYSSDGLHSLAVFFFFTAHHDNWIDRTQALGSDIPLVSVQKKILRSGVLLYVKYLQQSLEFLSFSFCIYYKLAPSNVPM